MENLMNALEQFEMKFDKGNRITFSEFVGEEHENKGLRTMCHLSGLEDHIKILIRMKKSGLCSWFFDDGWFHLTINNCELTEEFISELQFD